MGPLHLLLQLVCLPYLNQRSENGLFFFFLLSVLYKTYLHCIGGFGVQCPAHSARPLEFPTLGRYRFRNAQFDGFSRRAGPGLVLRSGPFLGHSGPGRPRPITSRRYPCQRAPSLTRAVKPTSRWQPPFIPYTMRVSHHHPCVRPMPVLENCCHHRTATQKHTKNKTFCFIFCRHFSMATVFFFYCGEDK